MKKNYQDVIQMLELLKANQLDVQTDYEAVEGVNELISKLKHLQNQ